MKNKLEHANPDNCKLPLHDLYEKNVQYKSLTNGTSLASQWDWNVTLLQRIDEFTHLCKINHWIYMTCVSIVKPKVFYVSFLYIYLSNGLTLPIIFII